MLLLSILLIGCQRGRGPSTEPMSNETLATLSDGQVLCSIAADIQALRGSHPQLREFRAAKHCNPDALVIGYQYHCDPPAGGAGWRGGTPNPKPDGIWLHLDFHDPDSTAQIHTQPVVMPRTFRQRDVMLLVVQGEASPPLGPELEAILQRHGVTSGR